MLVGLDDEEVVGRLPREPVMKARPNLREREALHAREREEGGDEPVELEPRVERRGAARNVTAELSNINAAPLPHLEPARALKVAVGRAHSVRVYAEASRELARRRQTLPRLQVVAHDPEHHLPHELLAQRHVRALRYPEAHRRFGV